MKFELRISLIYLALGALWILFSDYALNLLVDSTDMQHQLQTYKGWFYVFITSLALYIYSRRHLSKKREAEEQLAAHQKDLEATIQAKTHELNLALSDLHKQNQNLQEKSKIIQDKNLQLEAAMDSLKRAQTQLTQSEKLASIGLLTRGLAHEVNNPLNYISGALRGLEDQGIGESSEENAIYLKGIREGLDRVNRIVRSLHQFSSPGEEKIEAIDLGIMMENILTILKPELGARIKVQNDLPRNRFLIKGDRAELNQVFFNIILNAIQSIPGKGKLEVSGSITESTCLISIKDNGLGIPAEHLDKVMDPFFTTREPGKGVGLGLSMAYMSIEKHKGNLRLNSDLAQGTEVIIELPL